MCVTAAAASVSAPAAAAVTDTPAAAPAPVRVTSDRILITGDRVTVHSDKTVSVVPAAGREGMRFLSTSTPAGRSVIPVDALPLLRSGRLDPRLFALDPLTDATELPLLVAYPKSKSAQARTATGVAGTRVTRELTKVGMLAVRANAAGRADLWKSLTTGTDAARTLRAGVDRVWLDGKRRVNLDRSVPQIGAPAAWQAGLDGTGVKVAVLDTGIDATHPDFAGQIAESQNFTDTASTDDEVGHGTHVASTIAGTGAASGGRYKGVAPGAKLVIGKVCGTEYCEDSAILAGMEWAASRAPVINMSLGGGDTPEIDPLEAAVGELTQQYGTLFVISAGNAGGYQTLSSPASADAALAVAAVDRDDQLANFSSRGPRVGDNFLKPEISAPGVDIVAARAAHDRIGGPAPVEGYSSLSGTSMAAPHVAGSAAILTQQHPDWTPQQRKTVLMGAAKPTPGAEVEGQGAGRVDVARAITQEVAVDEGTLGFTGGQWPHGDDQPETKTVTYRNDGAAAVTLTLSLDAPALFSLTGPSTLTVPAGGTATTTVTSDTSVESPETYRGGYLTATGPGGLRVVAPVGVYVEPESYDVPVTVTGRDGVPAESAYTVFFDQETLRFFEIGGAGGTVRLPVGDYGVYSFVDSSDSSALLAQPLLVVDDADPVRIDARKAGRVRVTPPRADAVNTMLAASAEWLSDEWGVGAGTLGDEAHALYTGQIAPAAPLDIFTATIAASFARGSGRNSPEIWDFAWFRKGRMYTGLSKTVRARDMATIKAQYNAEAPGTEGAKANIGTLDGAGFWAVFTPFDLPFRRTEHVNTDGGQWQSQFYQSIPAASPEDFPTDVSWAQAPPRTLRAGQTYREVWNKAVFGPSVVGPQYPFDYVVRFGDTVFAAIRLFSEGSGHAGGSVVTSARTALYRGDTLIGENAAVWGEFAVPPEPATYRLEATASRGAPHTLSTSVTGSWTFRSATVPGDDPAHDAAQVPISTIRFDPALDDHNRASGTLRVPVHIDQQVPAAVRKVTVDVSYDDGATWKAVPVTGSGVHRAAVIRHPAGPGFVSLRATAVTAAGTAEQSVIRAYSIG
ncbi:S8 family serine peptidase [Symbioplanes lichenis]|uniref:S8 family serine peptidase n=1 Tax=Symbioplanes lichenis TaxID=1629072 RepID=UPI0027393578|nr:S8 family serine peptidase [Actinoplanes lichenis]